MKPFLYILLAFTFFLSSCRKKPMPPDETGDPVFYAKCEVNGVPMSISAGNSEYYMYSSFYRDTAEGLYVYKADLKQKQCTNACGYMLSLLINDHKATPASEPISVDDGLKVGSYLYSDKNIAPDLYIAHLQPASPYATGACTWTISDGQTVTTRNTASVDVTLSAKKNYTVTMVFDDYVGCYTQHTSVIRAGGALQATVSSTHNSLQQQLDFTFKAQTATPGQYLYKWEFGDGAVSTEAQPNHVFALQNSGYYTTTLTLVNPATSDTCITYYQVPATLGNVCLANFNTAFTPVPNIKSYSRVTLILTDPSGKEYSTKDFLQPDGSNFYIHEVESYNNNENGYPTKKLKISFNCILKSDGGDIYLRNGEAVLGVAYE